MQTNTISLSVYKLFRGKLDEIPVKSAGVINTLNTHSYVLGEKDETFRRALESSDVLLPDGIGVVWAVKRLRGEKIHKIAGSDIHLHILKELHGTGGKIYYLGSTREVLDGISCRISRECPGVKVRTMSPPFLPEFTEEQEKCILDDINNFTPDILFVGMTAPKQEKWVYKNRNRINAGTICSVGAVFDFYAGHIHRPSRWLIRHNLEWLGRLFMSPKRVWRRIFFSTPVFVSHINKLRRTPKD